jgi:hypothetical protein
MIPEISSALLLLVNLSLVMPGSRRSYASRSPPAAWDRGPQCIVRRLCRNPLSTAEELGNFPGEKSNEGPAHLSQEPDPLSIRRDWNVGVEHDVVGDAAYWPVGRGRSCQSSAKPAFISGDPTSTSPLNFQVFECNQHSDIRASPRHVFIP